MQEQSNAEPTEITELRAATLAMNAAKDALLHALQSNDSAETVGSLANAFATAETHWCDCLEATYLLKGRPEMTATDKVAALVDLGNACYKAANVATPLEIDATLREALGEDYFGTGSVATRIAAVTVASVAEIEHRIAEASLALLRHDEGCREYACLMRDGCPVRADLMEMLNEATNDYAEAVAHRD